MQGNKVEDSNLDKVVGGVVNGGGMAISIEGDNIVGVRSNEVITMSVTDCREALIEEGVSQKSVNQFFAMTKSDKEYNFGQINEATGIDLASIIKNNF